MLAVAVLAFARIPSAAAGEDAQWLARAAVAAADNGSAPFAVIDKRNARVFVFDATGRMQASSPVLLGLARGDDSVPGIGERPMSEIRREERTTPAGRFETEPGLNTKGEDIVWIDYDAAVSMHRVRATQRSERRLQRLASPTVADNRISYGCINVPAAFYDAHIKPVLGTHRGVVYVLPETMPAQKRFDFLSRPEKRG
ncbi:hypothetical protein GmRootV213_22580 [Variovorax sp. V213]